MSLFGKKALKEARKPVKLEDTSFFETGKNLFNKDTVTKNAFIYADTGEEKDNVDYNASDFIPVKPNTQYTKSSTKQSAAYDANKEFIEGISSVKTFTTPDNAAYVRMTVTHEGLDTFQLEQGGSETEFSPFRYELTEQEGPIDLYKGKVKDEVDSVKRKTNRFTKDGLLVWLDAMDISTNDGDRLSIWKDKSGNYKNATQTTDKYKPEFVKNSGGGLPSVRFGTNLRGTYLDLDKSLTNGKKGLTVIATAKVTRDFLVAPADQRRLFHASVSGSTSARFSLANTNSVKGQFRPQDDAEDAINVAKNPDFNGVSAENLQTQTVKVDLEKGEVYVLNNGFIQDSEQFDSSEGKFTDKDSYRLSLGGNEHATPFEGYISEFMVWDRCLSEDEQKEVEDYLGEKWQTVPIDKSNKYEISFNATATDNTDLTSTDYNYPTLAAVKLNNSLKPAKTVGYLFYDFDGINLYYSKDGINLNKIGEWDKTLANERPPQDYQFFITKDGDIICLIRGEFESGNDMRQNPIIYPSDDISNPVEVEIKGTKPTAWLGSAGIEQDYKSDNGTIMFGEYVRPGHDKGNVWRIQKPYTDPNSWEIVHSYDIVEGEFEHIHNCQKDPYDDKWYVTTGDLEDEVKVIRTTDAGDTWEQISGGTQALRILNFIFLKDGAYWANDGQTGARGLYMAPRSNGVLDFDNYKIISELAPRKQPTYATIYCHNPRGFLLLDKGEGRSDAKLSMTFYSLDDEKMYLLTTITSITGDTYLLGFRCVAFSLYQSTLNDGIMVGFGKKHRNEIDRINNNGNINNLRMTVF